MKREFKFRAWHKEASRMLFADTPRYVFAWADEGQPVDIMQFTGIRDRNDIEVYEGDIYDIYSPIENTESERLLYPNCSVVFHEGCYCFAVASDINGTACVPILAMPFYSLYGNNWVKKGNIYENPELLKKGCE